MSKEARDLIAAIREVALAELGENAEGAAVANLGSTSAHTIAVPVTVVVAETHIPAELVTSFANPARPSRARPTGVDPPRSVSGASRTVGERRFGGAARESPAEAPHDSETRRPARR